MMSSRVQVRWERGAKAIMDIRAGERVLTLRGLRRVKSIIKQEYDGLIYFMNRGEMATPNQLFWAGGDIWKTAEQLFQNPLPYKGPVWTIEIDTQKEDERNYTLGNGRLARNGD